MQGWELPLLVAHLCLSGFSGSIKHQHVWKFQLSWSSLAFTLVLILAPMVTLRFRWYKPSNFVFLFQGCLGFFRFLFDIQNFSVVNLYKRALGFFIGILLYLCISLGQIDKYPVLIYKWCIFQFIGIWFLSVLFWHFQHGYFRCFIECICDCLIIFHHMDLQQFTYAFTYWWTFELFPAWSYYE